ncbi:histone-lysine N-methyltransferase SETMAR [Trichonephila clavipes]|nr:histone-lysine N-methyltransferase SETMAR [Trichonephila clavipes]
MIVSQKGRPQNYLLSQQSFWDFGDFNATHNTWNCSHNSARATQLKDFADLVDLEIIYPNTPTSPDLTPSDFHLFLHLKSFLAGKHFNNDKELKENVSNWLKTQAATFYEEGIEKLVPRYDTCLQNFGSYVERKRTDIPALNTASGIAITNDQKVNLIANTLKDYFTENNRPSNSTLQLTLTSQMPWKMFSPSPYFYRSY